jgi:hypothetical protein
MRFFISVISFIVLNIAASGQGFTFYKENITLKIHRGCFYVTGVYYFRNDNSKTEALIYPFPVDPLYGAVDSLFIFNTTTNQVIKPLKTGLDGMAFKVDFSKLREQVIQVSYRQTLLDHRAEYILKSSIGWKKPLDQANYQLIVPLDMRISRFSIFPQDSIVTDHEVIYTWKKQNYFPSENLIFEYVNR